MHQLGCFLLKHDEEEDAHSDANPESTKAKLYMFCSFVDSHLLNQTCCRRGIAGKNNVGLMLVEVEGSDADVVLNLSDQLFEMDGVGDGAAEGVEFCLC